MECIGLKPCCEGASGMCGVICVRTVRMSHSTTLNGVQSLVMGQCDAGCVGSAWFKGHSRSHIYFGQTYSLVSFNNAHQQINLI